MWIMRSAGCLRVVAGFENGEPELVEWAANIDIPTPGELDGSEPVDDPPAGFATWDEWRRHRWPPSVS
jgi:hypothetical protein